MPSSRCSDSESNPRVRQVTAEVVLKHSGHREYLADICELWWLREHVNAVRAKWVQRPSSTTQVSFFSSPSVAKSKSPTAQEPCIQRRQREEEEKYAHLPSGLINHGNMTLCSKAFVSRLNHALTVLLITLVY